MIEEYRRHVLSFLDRPDGARRLKVVVDAANGMAVLDREIFEALGVELVPLYFELDGTFPNHEANPLKLENLRDLQAEVRETGADLGVSCDGDFDRAAFVDENGEPIGSDLATALIAGELLAHEPGKHVLYDLRSSRAVAEYIREKGGIPVRERVGPLVHEGDAAQSPGTVRRRARRATTTSATTTTPTAPSLAVIEVLEPALALRQADVRARRAAPPLRQEPGDQLRGRGQGRQDEASSKRPTPTAGIDWLDGITVQYDDWWFNVRPSNTEPLLRLVVEARTSGDLDRRFDELVGRIGQPVDH